MREEYLAALALVYYLMRIARNYVVEQSLQLEERRLVVQNNKRLDELAEERRKDRERVEAEFIKYSAMCEQIKAEMLKLQIKLAVLEDKELNYARHLE